MKHDRIKQIIRSKGYFRATPHSRERRSCDYMVRHGELREMTRKEVEARLEPWHSAAYYTLPHK